MRKDCFPEGWKALSHNLSLGAAILQEDMEISSSLSLLIFE